MPTSITEAKAITSKLSDSILLGAGIYAYNIVLDKQTGVVSDVGTILGCTSGGGKFAVKPNLKQLDIDQSHVARKGAYVKLGEEATIEPNLTEIKAEDVASFVMGEAKDGTNAKVVTSLESVQEDHYYENFGFIGFTAAGKPVVILFDHSLCTSGLELNPKKSEQSTAGLVFICLADLDSGDNKLPYTIIWPTASEGGTD